MSRKVLMIMCMIAVLTAGAQAARLPLQNLGFETGNFNGWTVVSSNAQQSVQGDVVYDGAYAAKLDDGSWINTTEMSLSQTVAVKAGSTYDLSVWWASGDSYKGVNKYTGGYTINLTIEWLDGSGGSLGVTPDSTVQNDQQKLIWRELTTSGTAPAGAAEGIVKISITPPSGTNQGAFYFDMLEVFPAELVAPAPDGVTGVTSPVDLDVIYEAAGEVVVGDLIYYMDPNEVWVANPTMAPQALDIDGESGTVTQNADPNFYDGNYQYTGQILEDTTYFWRVDTLVYEPNYDVVDPNFPEFNIPKLIEGDVWSFTGVLTDVEILTQPQHVFVQPDADTHEFDVANAEFTVTYVPLSAMVKWYKASAPGVALVDDDVNYSIETGSGSSTLTIIGVEVADNDDYYAVVTHPTGSPSLQTDYAMLRKALINCHRYSFNTGTVTGTTIEDLWGDADATVIDPEGTDITFTTDEMVFNPDSLYESGDPNSHYISLPSGILSALGDHATIVTWITWTNPYEPNAYFEHAFDFGGNDSEPPATGDNPQHFYFTMSDATEDFKSHLRATNPGTGDVTVRTEVFPTEQKICVIAVWDGTAGQMRAYLDGVQTGGNQALNQMLLDIIDDNNMLGRSQNYGNDIFRGNYDEFRIYDIALNQLWIDEIVAVGPDGDPNPCLGYNMYDIAGGPVDGEGNPTPDCQVNLVDLVEYVQDNWLFCGRLYGCD